MSFSVSVQRAEAIPNLHIRVDTLTSSGTWTAPAGVTSVTVELIGAGGGGTSGASNGGGGGGYSRCNTVAVTPSTGYAVVVGTSAANTNGGDSTFDTTTCVAKGGLSGANGGTGGQASAGTGDVKYNGGNSTTGTPGRVGGGGAGTTGAGTNGTGTGTSGAGGNYFGGFGGAAASDNSRAYGGGGGTGAAAQFSGYAGVAMITYEVEVPAGYPVVTARNFSRGTSNTTSHVVNLPACAVGDTLLVLFSQDGASSNTNTFTLPSDWHRVVDVSRSFITLGAFYKVAEGSDSLTVTSSASEISTDMSLCIRGATDSPSGTTSNGASGNSDSPEHTYMGGSGSHLWLAVHAADYFGGYTSTLPPSGYNDFLYLGPGIQDTGGSDVAVATRHNEAGSDDPGAFTDSHTTATAWAAATIVVPGAVSAATTTFPGAYSWWVYPMSVTIGSATYIGLVDPSGKQLAVRLNADGEYDGSAELYSAYSLDEHNVPAVSQLSDSSILWCWSGHNVASKTFCSKQTAFPSGIVTPVTLTTSGIATYSQILTRSSTVYVFVRVGNTKWSIFSSADDAGTWGSELPFLSDAGEQMYILARKPDADTMRVFVTSNGETANNHFWVMQVNLSTGLVTSGSTQLGYLDGSAAGGNTLPATRAELTSIFDASAGRCIRLLDTKPDASAFLYTEYDCDHSPDEASYHVARLTGADAFAPGSWTHTEIVDSGATFNGTSYFGGAVFANETHSGLRVYLSREGSGTWHIERWDSAAGDGSDWVTTELASDTDYLLRPVSPLGAPSSFPVYWQKGPSYTTWTDYDLSVVTWQTPSDTTSPTVSMTAPSNGATVSGSSITLSADASDNIAVAGVTFKVNGVMIDSEDTSSPYSVTWDSTATSSDSKIIVAVARDTSGNIATSSTITVTVDNTAPVISSIQNPPGGGGPISGPMSFGYINTNPTQVPISIAPINAPAPASIVSNSYKFIRNLAYHMTGSDVFELQRYLNTFGFMLAQNGLGSLGNETNYFGLLTYRALVKFQEAHASDILTPVGLEKGTGYFGPSTRAFVNKFLTTD